ncbi:MAG: methyltransferase domain-containing protein [Planctomycetota bacterium]
MEPEIVDISSPVRELPLEKQTPEGLAELGIIGIQVGSREFLQKNFLNTDLARLRGPDGSTTHRGALCEIDGALYFEHDCTTPFPVPDNTFEVVTSEHFIEHIHPDAALAWLKEMHRVLRPDGLLRVSTPDLQIYCAGYLDPEQKFFKEHRASLKGVVPGEVPTRKAWMVNQIFYGYGHTYIYDFDELVYTFERAGFDPSRAQRASFRQGLRPSIAALDLESHHDESVYAEITKA